MSQHSTQKPHYMQDPSTKSTQNMTTLETWMIVLNVLYFTYPFSVFVLLSLMVEYSASAALFIALGIYVLICTAAGFAALVLDLIYIRKVKPVGKRKTLAITSTIAITVGAIAINFIIANLSSIISY